MMDGTRRSEGELSGQQAPVNDKVDRATGVQRALDGVVAWALRRRALVITTVVVVTIGFGVASLRLSMNTDFSTYLADDSDVVREFNRTGDVFGLNYMALVVFRPADGGLFSYANLRKLQALTTEYEGIEGVDSVLSLINAPNAEATPYGVSVGDLVGEQIPQDEAALQRIRERATGTGLYQGVLLDRDGESTILLLGFAQNVDHVSLARRLIAVTDRYADADREFVFGGMPFTMFAMSEGIARNLVYLVPVILVLLMGILYLGLRSWQGMLFPLLVVIVSTVWLLGIMSLVGIELDMLTSVIPVILIAMGSADGIHLMRRIGEARVFSRDSVLEATRELALPMVLTSVTTMAGFASLGISGFGIIKRFGLATSAAVFVALVITLFFLPSLTSLVGPRRSRSADRPGAVARAMTGLADVVYRRRRRVLVGGLAVFAATLIAIPMIVVNVDWSLCLPRGSNPYEAEMVLRDRFGGSLPMQISVRGDMKSPAVLNRMRAIESYANSLPLIDQTSSVATMIAELNYVLNGRFSIPQSRQGVANLWLLMEGQETLKLVVAPERTEALIQGRVGNMATAALRDSATAVELFLAREPRQLVIVDRDLLSRAGQDSVRGLQIVRAAALLDWLLGPDDQRQYIESAMLTATRSGMKVHRPRMESFVEAYLTGDHAPVPLPAGVDLDSLAASIAIAVEEPSPDAVPTEEALRATLVLYIPELTDEDVHWLAEALRLEMQDYFRSRRVEIMYQALQQRLGLSTLSVDLEKRVRGALWQLESGEIALSLDEFENRASDLGPGRVDDITLSATMTGMVPVLNQMERELMPTQIKSVALTLGVILVILIAVFRSIRIGVIGIVPTLLTILTNFAVLGYAGIGLDSFTALIASVVIGLGIDYTIHFLARLRLEFGRQESDLEALRRTMQTTGISIMINALSVGLGFEVLVFAAGQHLRILGGLLGLSLMVSAVYTLTILPALILSTRSLRRKLPA